MNEAQTRFNKIDPKPGITEFNVVRDRETEKTAFFLG